MSDVALPQTIDPPTVSTSEVQSNFEALRDFVNGTDWLSVEKIPNGEITDAKLAAPNNAAYRRIDQATSVVAAGTTAAHYALRPGSTPVASAADMGTTPAQVLHLDAAHYTVAGKTTKLRVKTVVMQNNTDAAVTFTFGLYPVVPVNGANIALTLGTVFAGSTVAVPTGAVVAPSSIKTVGTDFTLDPVSGGNYYVLGVQLSGTTAVSSKVSLTAELEMRHV